MPFNSHMISNGAVYMCHVHVFGFKIGNQEVNYCFHREIHYSLHSI